VMHCTDHATEEAVIRELALIKVRVAPEMRTEVLQVSEHFACKTVDMTETSLIIMATGDTDKVDSCVRMLRKFDIVELVRTGKVLMVRGEEET
jgi:acetolactate synthase small subunit